MPGWSRVVLAAVLAASFSLAQVTTPVSRNVPRAAAARRIRVDTSLVLIPVTVTDGMNRFVGGLEKENFRLLEEDVEQVVSHFGTEDAPLSVGIVFDMSGSMGRKLQKSREAVAQLMKNANPEDEFFLVQFNDRPSVVVDFTRDAEELQSRSMFTVSRGRTALLDAIYLSLDRMRYARNQRRALVIISDGGDNCSRYSSREIKDRVREADVQIYAMGIFEPIPLRTRTAEEMSGPGLLSNISEQTGGRHFGIENLSEMPDVAARIANELHNHYVLGYAPHNRERDGKYRRVRVQIAPPSGLAALRAHWRRGYYAPGR